MPKITPRFGPAVIGDYEQRGERLAGACMRQINEAELSGLKLAAELEALAERIGYLIGTGQVATHQDSTTEAIDRTTRHLMLLHELRIRRSVAYGNLLLSIGPEETAVLLDKNPPINIEDYNHEE